jgi:hypothetical protein
MRAIRFGCFLLALANLVCAVGQFMGRGYWGAVGNLAAAVFIIWVMVHD